MGSKLEQSAQPMSYSEAKTILRNNFRMEWRQRLDIGTEEDSILQLDRAAQVTIFRLRTGHCQLLSHLHRLKISHSDECPCGTGPQTPNHILHSCPTFDALRRETWPSPVDAHRKLWGLVETAKVNSYLEIDGSGLTPCSFNYSVWIRTISIIVSSLCCLLRNCGRLVLFLQL